MKLHCVAWLRDQDRTTGEMMQQVSDRNFGLLIAYILPGFVALVGLSAVSPTIRLWLSVASSEQAPTVAGFLYVTLASVGLGMAVGALRWFIIDRINEATGLARPEWDDAKLQKNLDAFNLVVEQHYRHYQCYANTLVSFAITYVAHRIAFGFDYWLGTLELGLIAIGIVFWAMARDTLRKYYKRATTVLAD